MDRNTLFNILLNNFGFTPTEGQAKVLYHLSAFILTEKERPVYLLRGYAGTGKTTLVSALVKTLPSLGMRYQLLAPTGRAAKVMSTYTGKAASTLHRKLYRFQVNANGEFRMARAENKAKDTIFIVDECSMISDQGDGYSWSRSLLDDLIEYVFSGSCCKLLLIGDSAQLPPVGLDISPAMDFDILKNSFALTLATYEMKEVMRQNLDSGILYNATEIRNLMSTGQQSTVFYDNQFELPLLDIKNFSDIEKIDPMSFEELLWQSFGDKRNNNDAVVICRSNKRANMFNQAIRSRVLQEEGELSTGDKLMVVKNNYYWSGQQSTVSSQQSTVNSQRSMASNQAVPELVEGTTKGFGTSTSSVTETSQQLNISFIANGDMIEIMRINKFEEMYGFHFADVDIQLTDYEEAPTLSVKIIMETLYSDSPALTNEEAKRLYQAVEEDYMDIPKAADRRKAMKDNPYYNALQVKFGYALTCHKTQGG
ncbi:MAG: AAA family ATPase, partial [Bacteroidales bacterium]|nr:AAA family ATPase [Bacteroidales bacterium]